MKRGLFGAALAVMAAGIGLCSLAPAGPAKQYARWQLSWDAAKAEALERNVPIFITFHQDG